MAACRAGVSALRRCHRHSILRRFAAHAVLHGVVRAGRSRPRRARLPVTRAYGTMAAAQRVTVQLLRRRPDTRIVRPRRTQRGALSDRTEDLSMAQVKIFGATAQLTPIKVHL